MKTTLWIRLLQCPAAFVISVAAYGQVMPHGSNTPLVGPDYTITEAEGQVSGGNLFHSFSQFDLSEGQSATFTGPSSIQNVLVRVTGGTASTIDGTLNCDIPGANFVFVNPFGVVFGEHAQVNVSGSFAVTTADYVKLGANGRFDARNLANDVLTTAPPSAFGFLGPTVAPISIAGPADLSSTPTIIQVTDGKSLWIVGGDVTIENNYLAAPGGELVAVSIASDGELGINLDDANAAVDVSTFSTLGNLTVANLANLDVSGVPSGDVALEGNEVRLAAGAAVSANNFGDSEGGNIEMRGRSLIELDQASLAVFVVSEGDGGNVALTAPMILIRGGSNINTDTLGNGDAGDIRVTADEFTMIEGGQVSVTTSAGGAGGQLHIQASHVLLDGTGETAPALFAFTFSGPAGLVLIESDVVELKAGGLIQSDSLSPDSVGGDVHITAQTLTLDAEYGLPTGISTRSIDAGTGGGNIVLDVDHLELRKGARVTASSENAGVGGSIVVNGDTVKVDTESAIEGAATADGTAGSVTITLSDALQLKNGGQLNVSAAQNAGGDVTATAGREIRLVDGEITARAFGDGGNIHISAPDLVYLQDSHIEAESINGNGGNVVVDPLFVVLNNSTIVASAITGNGGNITIVADFFLASQSRIDASSAFGLQGTVSIVGPDVDLTGSLVGLTTELLDATTLLRPDCAVRLPVGASSLTVLGRGGLPVEPDALLPATQSVGADDVN